MIDVWANYNQSLQNLGSAFDDQQKQAAQRLQMQLTNQQIESNQMAMDDKRRQLSDSLALRTKLQTAQPETVTSFTPPTPNKSAAVAQLEDMSVPVLKYTTPAAADPALMADMQQEGLADTAPVASGFKLPAEPVSPAVAAYGEGRVQTTTKEPNYHKIVMDHARQTGNTELVQKTAEEIMKQAGNIASMTGNMADATSYFNEATGANLKYLGKKGDVEVIKLDNGNIAAVDKTKLAQGIPLKEATTTMQTGGNNQAFLSALSQLPENASANTVYKLASDLNIKMEDANKAVDNLKQQQGQNYKQRSRPDGRQLVYEESTDGGRTWKEVSRGDKDRPASITINGPSADNIETLAQMVAKGEMDASQLPKRQGLFNEVIARAKQLNPQLNVRNSTADFSLAKNPTFRQRAITAESLPEVMNSMVELGKKLDFPEAKFVGKVKAWGMGQFNDPTFTEYMALRNDALMEIASVMRGSGMTDMAHKAETEVSNPTMSPRALDAWLRAQNKALQPRIKRFNNVIGNQQPTASADRPPLGAIFGNSQGR